MTVQQSPKCGDVGKEHSEESGGSGQCKGPPAGGELARSGLSGDAVGRRAGAQWEVTPARRQGRGVGGLGGHGKGLGLM